MKKYIARVALALMALALVAGISAMVGVWYAGPIVVGLLVLFVGFLLLAAWLLDVAEI